MRKGLTKRQKECYDFICQYIREKSISPTLSEICEAMHTTSRSNAHNFLRLLEQRGYITRLPHRARSIAITGDDNAEMSRLHQIAGAAKSYFQAHDAWQVFQHRHPHHADNSEYHAPLVSERFNRLKELVQ